MQDRSERRILKALRERRREAYEDVIDAHYASVYRLVLFLTRDAHAAEDLTQEVFASAWGAIHDFRGDASLRTWLHRIAYHAFLDMRRRRQRDDSLAERLAGGGSDSGPAAEPLSRLMADEKLAWVYRAMDRLDMEERALLVLHYVEGLSYREMAQILHRSDGTLKWMVNRTVKKLRQQLGEQVEQ